ncbi:MAG TPA: YeeE/YedE thiosulfate transporter family protein [Lacipirellulaceae bacterium]|nr:YeeE/YedE thiosulfate transporter family protein [Lacipirellulaceae bacterium]
MRTAATLGTMAIILLAASTAWAQQPTTSPEAYSGPAWSPYLVGALIGVLSMFTFYFSRKPLGASTAYARIAGMIGSVIAPKHTKSLKFYQDKKPVVDWEVMLLVGVVVGAFLAAFLGNELTLRWVPPMWEARFGESVGLRLAAAFGGGLLMAFGARLAGGCTSGHGISGTMQLAVGSWIAVICFFVGGIATAMLMFRI